MVLSTKGSSLGGYGRGEESLSGATERYTTGSGRMDGKLGAGCGLVTRGRVTSGSGSRTESRGSGCS